MTALLFLALYTALMVGATLIFARKGDGKEDFFLRIMTEGTDNYSRAEIITKR